MRVRFKGIPSCERRRFTIANKNNDKTILPEKKKFRKKFERIKRSFVIKRHEKLAIQIFGSQENVDQFLEKGRKVQKTFIQEENHDNQ